MDRSFSCGKTLIGYSDLMLADIEQKLSQRLPISTEEASWLFEHATDETLQRLASD